MGVLKNRVLVLNAGWTAIRIRSVKDALKLVFVDRAFILDTDTYQTCTWDQWIALPIPEGKIGITTTREPVRLPEIIILKKFNKVPQITRLTKRKIFLRDENKCQYTGRQLEPKDANVDHIIPKSRGGKFSWDNCVTCCKEINTLKGDRTPEEAGLKLIRKPKRPSVPILIDKTKPNPESWDKFLNSSKN